MKADNKVLILTVLSVCLPVLASAQGSAQYVKGLHQVLDNVYNDMVPMYSAVISIAKGIAGFGALWYIAYRVWGNIARAEPIDFYPLLRPFALGLAILFYSVVIDVLNGVLKPTAEGTSSIVVNSDLAIKNLLKQKEAQLKKTKKWKAMVGDDGMGDRKEWYKFMNPKKGDKKEGWFESISNDFIFWMDKQDYKMRHGIRQYMSELFEILYYAASLCINTLRTFFLIVMTILGPLVFGFAVFDGMQHTLSVWLARYINIYLWLPVANIFGAILGKVQQNMIKLDITEVQQSGDTFFSSTDTAYLIFLIIGLIGYFYVPNVANYIIHAGGGNGILNKVNSLATLAMSGGKQSAKKSAAGLREGAGMIVDRFDNTRRNLELGAADAAGQDYFKDKVSGK